MNRSTNDSATGDRLNPIVFYSSVIGIIAFSAWTIAFTHQAGDVLNVAKTWIANTFGWYYFLTVIIYLVFIIGVAVSRLGSVRLGPEQSRPEFNLFSWSAMLFAAGIGIGVIFWSVDEPLTQFYKAPDTPADSVAAARHAMEITFLHWGVSAWSVYSLIGMSLAFFSYRYDLPLTIRSGLYPIFGERIHGWIGHTVDTAAVVTTVFGIAAALGVGIIQLNFGLNYMFGIAQSVWTQIILVVLIVAFSTLSAVTGVERGIRRLSELNVLLAVLLLLFLLLAGKTLFLLNALVLNVGDYIRDFISLSTNTYAFDPPTSWLDSWTIFFWAWWIAWGPFVGLFLARISRGRTIREFVAGTMTLPVIFMMIWMSFLGNSSLDLVMHGAGSDFGHQVMNNPAAGIYLLLNAYPWTIFTTVVVSILGIIFFVTSGDSGALVLSNFTSILADVNNDAPVWMRIVWSAIIGLVTLALLLAGGLSTLQSAVVITGLPFSIVLFFMMAGLYKALRMEAIKRDSQRVSLPGYLSGRIRGTGRDAFNWRTRVARAMHFPSHRQAVRHLAHTIRPAMEEVSQALCEQGVTAEIQQGETEDKHLALNVIFADEQNFSYQVWPRQFTTPAFAIRTQQSGAYYYRLEVYLTEGSQGYDLMGYSREQAISDILDQYESHLHFLHLNRETPGQAALPDSPETMENQV